MSKIARPPTKIRSFPPVLPKTPCILILGSMPGVASLRQQQYYAHPRNAFWTIMGTLLDFDPKVPYRKRIATLKHSNIALWDVLKFCERQGSLDANIKTSTETTNEIDQLLNKHPTIHTIFLNGQKASTCFRRHITPLLKKNSVNIEIITLPSSSPANARLTPLNKINCWHQAIRPSLTK